MDAFATFLSILTASSSILSGTSSATSTSQASITSTATYYLPGACPSTFGLAASVLFCQPPNVSPQDQGHEVFVVPNESTNVTDSAWAMYTSSYISSMTIQTLPPSPTSTSSISGGYGSSTAATSSSLQGVSGSSSSPILSASSTSLLSSPVLSTGSTLSMSSTQPTSNASSSCASTANESGMRYRGLNMNNFSPSGNTTFRTEADWNKAFKNIRSLPGNFNAIRTYSTTDIDTSPDGGPEKMVRHLERLLPAAQSYNLSVHVGVWSGGDQGQARFVTEKNALNQTLQKHGCKNIIAVSIGNEDIYRNNTKDVKSRQPLTDIFTLVNQTQDIMDILDEHKCCGVPVTHTDTFGEWLRDTSDAVLPLIQQVDFLTVNIFPWWENVTIDDANATFWQHLQDVTEVASKHNKSVWIGETGWPLKVISKDPTIPSGVASVANMQRYYNEVACSLWKQANAFFYVDWDAGPTVSQSPSFGLMDHDGHPLIDLSCA